jgi:RNA polymerase subunit RPABC4/transcription elongation factor Spt4
MKNIKCPKCSWKPTGEALWVCESKCNQVWDTFSTFGTCPKCSKRWEKTRCPACSSWSLHEDWYGDLSPLLKQELSKIEKESTLKKVSNDK